MSLQYLKMLQSADKHLTRRMSGIQEVVLYWSMTIYTFWNLLPKLSVPIGERDVGELSSNSKCAY